jgi:hypothetical protein
MFIEGERKRKGIGYRIVKIYRYEETLERINLGYNLQIHYRKKLEYSDEMKYLGVTVQKRMSWARHVNERVRKAGKLMNMVRNVIGQKWGA